MLKVTTPLPLMIEPASCQAWFDMSDISAANMTSSGGLVNKILNKTGSGNNIQQGTSSAQPKNNTLTYNGLPVLEFGHDGILNDFMNFDSNEAGDTPFTVFVVGLNRGGGSGPQAFIGRQTAAINGQWVIRRESSGGVFNAFGYGAGAGSSQAAKAGNNNANIHNVTFASGQGITYRLNNDSPATGAVRSGQDNDVLTGLALGAANPAGGNPLNGWIGEIIIYNKVLSASQITQINQYLSRKWGIAIS